MSMLGWAIVLGLFCTIPYLVISWKRKRIPLLHHGIEAIMSGIGLVGGFKILWLAINGEIQQLISTKPAGVAPNISSEDVIYFAIGGFALVWLSIETIWKRYLD